MWASRCVSRLLDWTQFRRTFSVEISSLSKQEPIIDISGEKMMPENADSLIFDQQSPRTHRATSHCDLGCIWETENPESATGIRD
jgi:hypothetical protein